MLGTVALAQDAIPSENTPAVQPVPEIPPETFAEQQQVPAYATVDVRLETGLGPITLRLEEERAPVTTANFLKYVDERRLDGIEFFRAVTFAEREDLGLVQAGLRDGARLLPPIAHESTVKTRLSHVDGAISMARAEPGSARADFFIIVGGLPGLDANPEAPGDNAGYAVFGHVTEGMEIVRQILFGRIDPAKGEGIMKGQMLAQPVAIRTARRLPK